MIGATKGRGLHGPMLSCLRREKANYYRLTINHWVRSPYHDNFSPGESGGL